MNQIKNEANFNGLTKEMIRDSLDSIVVSLKHIKEQSILLHLE